MKKTIIFAAAAFIAFAAACSGKKEAPVKLAAGTPAYQLAKDAAKVLPALDPDKAAVVVSTKSFDITAAEVIQTMFDTMGAERAAKFKDIETARMKAFVDQTAVKIAERRLLLEAARTAKQEVTPEEVKAAIDAQIERAGGQEKYDQLLKTNGVTSDSIKKGLSEDLAIQKYLNGILTPAGQVTEAELRKAYGEDKTATVRHILLLTQGKSAAEKAEARKKIEDLLARAKKGEDFAELARQYSEDEGSKANGGLYEDFGRGKMVRPFDEAAFTVPVGQISGVVETTYGYHILKIENRKKETRPFDEVKTELEGQVRQQKQVAAVEARMSTLKKSAKFKVLGL